MWDQERSPNLATDQLTSAPTEILPAMEALSSSIVVEGDRWDEAASPACSQPLDALLESGRELGLSGNERAIVAAVVDSHHQPQ